MIGKITGGKSYKGCLRYCLSNKPGQNGTGDRAEVIDYNYCYGNLKEVTGQFEDVGKLNPKLTNKVMHITLSFPPRETLSQGKLREIADECAKKMGYEKNQSIVIVHNDTKHQHMHIVVNRVGYDGKTVSDSNNYKKISDFCREMENKYKLQRVDSPRKYQSKEQRSEPRQDKRKDKLKSDIRDVLNLSKSYTEFEKIMKNFGYEVIKGRGVAFRDRQKVYTKGSQVGYPLTKIEKIWDSKAKSKAINLLNKSIQSKGALDKLILKNSKNINRDLLINNLENNQSFLPVFKKKRKRKPRTVFGL
jgi:hypothetical protein